MAHQSAPMLERQQRVVRVFVSSTFRDMHEEREELVKRIFPQLRKLCEERGVTWGEVDLRWGITKEEAERGQVLPICLAEIQRCQPYFIGILGERYGWIPDEIPQDLVEREEWLAEHRHHSVTELEILHGVLNNPEMANHAFFYFRRPSFVDSVPAEQREVFCEIPTREEVERFGAEEAERRAAERRRNLAKLKDEIRASGFPVRENYDDARTLGQLVLKDFTDLIEKLYPQGSEPNPLEREIAEHEAFARSRAQVYITRPDYFRLLDAHAAGDGPPLVVLGASGAGKSALLANWAREYRARHPETQVITHFTGATSISSRWEALLMHVMWELKRRFRIEHEAPSDVNQLGRAFADWLGEAAEQGRTVLALDALDKLEDCDGAPDLVWLPTELPSNVRLVVSTLPGRPLDSMTRRGCKTLEVAPLSTDERRSLTEEYLALYTKRLNAAHAESIARALPTSNPLYLRTLLEELRIYGEHETLEARINYYLAAHDVASLYQKILERYEQDYERERTGLVGDCMSLLWAARRGLSEAELLELLGGNDEPLPHAYWSPLYLAAEPSLVNRLGLLGFSHDYLRQAVRERYLYNERLRLDAHQTLADYFDARELNPRKVEELPWQLARVKDWEALRSLLADLEFFESARRAGKFDVQSYWTQIEANSPLRMVDTYRHVLDAPGAHTEHLSGLAGLFINTGHHREALALREHLIEHYRRTGDEQNLQAELSIRANILAMRGDLKQAAALLEEGEQLASRTGRSRQQQLIALQTRAGILQKQGDLTEALGLFKETETLARELGFKADLISSLINQSNILQLQHDLGGASALNQEAERLCRAEGDKDTLQRVLFNQSHILRQRGDIRGALDLLAEQELLSREIGGKRELASSLYMQAALMVSSGGDRRAAKLKCEEALPLFRDLEMPVEAKKAATMLRLIESGMSPKLMKVILLIILLSIIALGIGLGLWRPWLWLLGAPLVLIALLVFLLNFVTPVREASEKFLKQTQADIERESQ